MDGTAAGAPKGDEAHCAKDGEGEPAAGAADDVEPAGAAPHGQNGNVGDEQPPLGGGEPMETQHNAAPDAVAEPAAAPTVETAEERVAG